MTTLALFDLDNTLLSGDSDYEWGEYLVKKGLVDKKAYAEANQYFLEQYQEGTLDIIEFTRFAFTPLAENSLDDLLQWRADYLEDSIKPLITEKALDLVEKHKQQGDTLVVITATNSFITRPIVDLFGIEHLIATEIKQIDNRFVAEIDGTPCFQEGKVTRLNQWLQQQSATLQGSYFYSDSHNDLPLLEQVDHAIAVDPDEKLEKIALKNHWSIISLR
ncbi:MAG: HAD family hydrolase [Thiotrichaceae bacterium]|nr:HAD family hydrolase [Thiotrichaceae bacterium]